MHKLAKTAIASFLLSCTQVSALTIVPFERDAPRDYKVNYGISQNLDSLFFSTVHRVDHDEQRYFHGYNFYNYGPNIIVPSEGQGHMTREYYFSTHDHAKRDVYLWVTDNIGYGNVSDMMESFFVFLPRENQIHFEESGDEILVTLNTGEEVIFSKKEKTIVSGVLSEGPVDTNPNRSNRKFADIKYNGTGTMIRLDKRAGDPRLGTTAQIYRPGKKVCKVKSSYFFTQTGWPNFKEVSDDVVERLIVKLCD